MESEVEDIVGEVKYTESQKSVTTSNVYSLDFTDSSSDKNNSSSKETYVLDWDDSEDEAMFQDARQISKKNSKDNKEKSSQEDVQKSKQLLQVAKSKHVHSCAIVSQEIFTQTSKTIIELAESDGLFRKIAESKTLETQTSFVSIKQNQTIEYRIELKQSNHNFPNYKKSPQESIDSEPYNENRDLNLSLEDGSSKLTVSDAESITSVFNNSSDSLNDQVQFIDDESREEIVIPRYENTSDFDSSGSESGIEEDSLNVNTIGKRCLPASDIVSVTDDVKPIYVKRKEKTDNNHKHRHEEETRRFGILTPLSEESMKRQSLLDITPSLQTIVNKSRVVDNDILFTNKGLNVKLLPEGTNHLFKLPPIKNNQSCPGSPHLNFLFPAKTEDSSAKTLCKAGTLPCLFQMKGNNPKTDRWEIKTKDLASGERFHINRINDPKTNTIQLPPIVFDGSMNINVEIGTKSNAKGDLAMDPSQESISIKEKIKELKQSHKIKPWTNTRSRPQSRSLSPRSIATSPSCETRLSDAAERGCETLCVEILKRLRSSSWLEVVETLKETPVVFDKFWGVISENRIADLIRQVSVQVDSPRTQVARAACSTLAAIIKNTNYTKKPDFYEATTSLLVKTGSFSRPVRRAANVALDQIVSGVEVTHAVTALCVNGVGHKNALVRCAAARLLVVSCALAAGGRGLLRARPPSAAFARKQALRSLAALLEDKGSDARKYAERLYSMLRPLPNFEAYYLTDVEVETATRQMKRFDQSLLCGPPATQAR